MRPYYLICRTALCTVLALLASLNAFSQTPPHIIASANYTSFTFCKSSQTTAIIRYRYYNAGETPATGLQQHHSAGGGSGTITGGSYVGPSLDTIGPGETTEYYKSVNYVGNEQTIDINYTDTFYLTCAEPGATYQTASIHIQNLNGVPSQVTTQAATNFTATSATLNGNIAFAGQCPQLTNGGFLISTSPAANTGSFVNASASATGPYSYTIQNLLPATTYYYDARFSAATNNSATLTSSFTTPAAVANDLCANAIPLPISAAAVQGSFANSTNNDVYYSFTPNVTGTYYVTIDNFGTQGNKNLAILNSCGGSVIGSGYSASLNTETASASLTAGNTYYIQVIDADQHYDTFDIRIDPPYPVLSTNGTSAITINNYYNDTFSASKSFTLTGIDLEGAPGVITVSATNSSFEFSLDNTNWSSAVDVSYSSINLASNVIYVRMPAQSLGTKTANVTFSGGGVVNAPVVTLTGTAVLRPPTIYNNGAASFSFGTFPLPTVTASQSFNISGIRLIGFPAAVTVTASSADFQVSADNVNWASTASIPYDTETLPLTPVYVRFNSQNLGTRTGSITFSAPGLSGAPSVSVSGTSTITAPTGLTAATANSFSTVSWNPVPGAISYTLDVDGNPAFNTAVTPLNLTTWNLSSNANASGGLTTASVSNPFLAVGTNPLTIFNAGFGANTTNWTNGNGTKYWQASFSTAGYSQIKVSFVQRGTATGPRDFKLQYKITANGVWADVPGGTITLTTANTAVNGLSLPAACSNKPLVFLRWVMTSDIAVNGGGIAVSASSYIRTVVIYGGNPNYVPFKGYTLNATSQLIPGLTPGKTYYYRVRAQGPSASQISNFTVANTTTGTASVWNGTQWTPEIPDDRIDASVTGPYVSGTNGEFTSRSLTVNAGGSVTVSGGSNITVTGMLTNTQSASAFVVENDANLIQAGTANDNSGVVTVKRNTSMNRLDYTYWSSPVASQNLLAFSPLTLANRFYEGNESNDSFIAPQLAEFVAAKGYCIRAPNNFPAAPAAPQTFDGLFTGVPNKGTITIPLAHAGQGFNLIGNPYPSPISITAFLDSNPGIGAVYFWTHKVLAGDNAANYTSVNRTGATVAPGTPTPNGTIQTGQGFMVSTGAAGTATFLDNMRVANNQGQFYRTGSLSVTEGSRIWLNIADSNKAVGQMLTGYVGSATNDLDFAFDGKAIESTGTQLYSVINGEAYIIQGRALPFEPADSVPLGFKAANAGNYTISVDHMDGLFSEGQDVFLKDGMAGITTDLKAAPYTFASEAGVFNSRFKLVYQNSTLGTDTPEITAAGFVVYKADGKISINSGTVVMQDVKVYDMLGQLLFEDSAVNDTVATIGTLNVSNQVVIVKVQTLKGIFSKKVVL